MTDPGVALEAMARASMATVLRDVVATTPLRLQVSSWDGADSSIGWAVHETGVRPRAPVWEAFQLLDGGDSIALHHLPASSPSTPGDGDLDDLVIAVARGVQDLTHVLLWRSGLDPAWPGCPAHPGQHPMRILDRRLTRSMRDGRPVVTDDTGARWTCPRDLVTISIGQL